MARLAVYANDEAGFTRNCDLHDKECGAPRAAELPGALFAAVPLASDWLDSRHPVIQLTLFDAKLSAFLHTGVPGPGPPELLGYYRTQEDKTSFAAVRPALRLFDLFAGKLHGVQRGIAAIEDPAGLMRQAMEGTVDFLSGRNGAALQRFRDALRLHRKQAGKPQDVPPGRRARPVLPDGLAARQRRRIAGGGASRA